MIVTTVSGARCAAASPGSRVASSRSRPARGTGTVARSFNNNRRSDEGKSRRELLADLALSTICVGSAGALDPTLAALAEEDLLPVKSLPKGAKASQAQEIYDLIQAAVRKNVTEDYTKILQLAFLDAISYDKAGKTGGANGSIVLFPDELKALGLESSLGTAAKQVKQAREDAQSASAFPLTLSVADVLYGAAFFKTRGKFVGDIIDKAKDQASANIILQGYGNDFPMPPLGRVDASAPEAAALPSLKTTDLAERALSNGLITGQIVALSACFPEGASREQVEEEMKAFGGKFQFYVKSNQQSRSTLTQTNYQIDFGQGFFKLSTQGAKFDIERYYHPIPKVTKNVKL